MELTIQTPALLFPAVSLLLIAYTNKFLAIANLIRENKVAQMYSSIQTGQQFGMQTLDQCLKNLVGKGLISPAVARSAAKIPENF